MNNLFSNVDLMKLQGDVRPQTRTVIHNVFLFLNELKSDPKKLDSINFNKPREMAALICGVSRATVDRIKTEVVQSGRPCKPRTNYKKPVSVTNIDDFDKSVLKRTIASFYDNGEYPTVDKIIEKYRELMPDFKCGNTSMRKILKEIGYKCKKNAGGRKYLIERSDIVAMGCDGGTIPRRDELVRLKKTPEQQKDKDAERSFKWRNCALSQQPLQAPVVACGLGRLYNKSSVLEALIDKESKPDSISHIQNLKDVKDLNLIKNPAFKETGHTDSAVAEGNAPYICPISGIKMSGKFRFVFLWSCGCVLAERALKEVKQNICHMCQSPFTDNDIVVLNGTEEDVEKLKDKMVSRAANRKSSKKSKADKTVKTEVKSEASTSQASTEPSTSTEIKQEEEVKTEPEPGPSNTTKKEIDTIPLSLPKFNPNHKARGHFGSSKRAFPSTELQQDPSYKKTKKDYNVAKDP